MRAEMLISNIGQPTKLAILHRLQSGLINMENQSA